MARYDDLDTRTIAYASVLSAVVLLILILAGRAMAYAWESAVEAQKVGGARYTVAEQEIANQKQVLQQSATLEEVVEEGQPPVTRRVIPIDRAFELVREEPAAAAGT